MESGRDLKGGDTEVVVLRVEDIARSIFSMSIFRSSESSKAFRIQSGGRMVDPNP